MKTEEGMKSMFQQSDTLTVEAVLNMERRLSGHYISSSHIRRYMSSRQPLIAMVA
jgi:hypothetical protein